MKVISLAQALCMNLIPRSGHLAGRDARFGLEFGQNVTNVGHFNAKFGSDWSDLSDF